MAYLGKSISTSYTCKLDLLRIRQIPYTGRTLSSTLSLCLVEASNSGKGKFNDKVEVREMCADVCFRRPGNIVYVWIQGIFIVQDITKPATATACDYSWTWFRGEEICDWIIFHGVINFWIIWTTIGVNGYLPLLLYKKCYCDIGGLVNRNAKWNWNRYYWLIRRWFVRPICFVRYFDCWYRWRKSILTFHWNPWKERLVIKNFIYR